MTYAAEARPDTAVAKQMMSTAEMKIIRTIHGKTLRNRIRNENLKSHEKNHPRHNKISQTKKKILE